MLLIFLELGVDSEGSWALVPGVIGRPAPRDVRLVRALWSPLDDIWGSLSEEWGAGADPPGAQGSCAPYGTH